MSLAEAAAFLTSQWPVFPCGADKRPITPHGFKDATRDPALTRAMFRAPAAALIGVPTGEASDLAVVDLDCKDGAAGLEWLAANEARLPRTRRHRTRSGGVHLLFRYPQGRTIRNSASKIAPGVDVRGNGGYIVAPPSDGYSIADDAMPADMPAWLVDLLDPPTPAPAPRPTVAREWRDTAAPGSRYGLAALEEEADAICNAPFGQQEHTLNSAALKIGALVAGGELEPGYARETLIRAGLAMRSQPGERPWVPEEIRRKVERAFSDGQRSPRQAPPRAEPPRRQEPPMDAADRDAWQQERQTAHLVEPQPRAPLPLVYFGDIEPSIDGADFVEGVLTDGGMSVLYGESNAGKTFFATDLALHVALGRTWQGRAVDGGGVIYCALEGGFGIRNRVAAWRIFHQLQTNREAVPFAIIPVSLDLLRPDGDTARLIDTIGEAAHRMGGVRLTVMDTLSRAMAGGNENSPEDMGALVRNGDAIREATSSHCLWIHHSGKDQARGARGHSLLRAATDTELEIAREHTKAPSVVTVKKQRDMEISGEWVFTLRSVELGTNRRGKPVTSAVIQPAEREAPDEAAPRLPDDARRALEILTDLCASEPRPGIRAMHDVPASAPSVPEGAWRDAFFSRAKAGADYEAKKKSFRRAADLLLKLGRIGVFGGRVWPC